MQLILRNYVSIKTKNKDACNHLLESSSSIQNIKLKKENRRIRHSWHVFR